MIGKIKDVKVKASRDVFILAGKGEGVKDDYLGEVISVRLGPQQDRTSEDGKGLSKQAVCNLDR